MFLFLTPRIIRTDDDATAVTEPRRQRAPDPMSVDVIAALLIGDSKPMRSLRRLQRTPLNHKRRAQPRGRALRRALQLACVRIESAFRSVENLHIGDLRWALVHLEG